MIVYNGVSQRINFPMIFTYNSFCNESTVKTERESNALKEKDPVSEMSTTIFQSSVNVRSGLARSPEPKAHVSNVRVFWIELELEFRSVNFRERLENLRPGSNAQLYMCRI